MSHQIVIIIQYFLSHNLSGLKYSSEAPQKVLVSIVFLKSYDIASCYLCQYFSAIFSDQQLVLLVKSLHSIQIHDMHTHAH